MDLKRRLEISLVFLTMLAVAQACTSNFTVKPLPTLPIPTATVTHPPINTPRPTEATPPTPDDVATLHAVETASIQTLTSAAPPQVLEEYPSPDGKWRAEVIRYDCINYQYPDYVGRIAYEQLKLISLMDGNENIIEDQLQNCDGIGGGGLKGLYWSPNNRYFYYTDWREGYPEGCGNYLVPAVYRFDTLTQERLTVGNGHVSPDQTKLAMWEWQKNEIVIWDLDQGEVARVQTLERMRFHGEISWSPDGQSIVYLQTEWDCAPDYGKTYLTRLDVVDLSQELLLEQETPGFGEVSWETMDQLALRDGNNNMWTYNLVSKELKAGP